MGCSAQLIQVGSEASTRDQPSLKTHHFIMGLEVTGVALWERTHSANKLEQAELFGSGFAPLGQLQGKKSTNDNSLLFCNTGKTGKGRINRS
jgi:hypothetical protein